jgi:hypothetical protein
MVWGFLRGHFSKNKPTLAIAFEGRNVEKELKALDFCGLPGAEWTAKMLRISSPQMP